VTTKELELEIYLALSKTGTYLCFEVMMPSCFSGGQGFANERVDLLTYDKKGDWRFYELKISVSDFRSKSHKTFLGNLNYFVMPRDIYLKVKEEIPKDIGCFVSCDNFCYCIKKAKRRDLQIHEEPLKYAFMQALSRQHGKLMKLRLNEKTKTSNEVDK